MDLWAKLGLQQFIPQLCTQDIFVKKSLKRIREKTSEKEMWVEGEFASEDYMLNKMKLKEYLGCK